VGRRVLFVDYENVQAVEPAHVPQDVVVKVFFGNHQGKVPRHLVELARVRGPEGYFEIDLKGSKGKNALDFHIAFALGECLTNDGDAECVVLSRDKGFDALLGYLRSEGHNVRRVEDSKDAFAAGSRTAAKPRVIIPDVQQVLLFLRKLPPEARPGTRAALIKHVGNHFHEMPKDKAASVVAKLLDSTTGIVQDEKGKLTYQNFPTAPPDA
jgi:hypothetical protein